MEQVTGYKTKDNKFFVLKEEAEKYESELNFTNWCKKSGNLWRGVTPKILCKWLRQNKEQVLALIEEEK